jgi:hypothetical protein
MGAGLLFSVFAAAYYFIVVYKLHATLRIVSAAPQQNPPSPSTAAKRRC